MKRDKNNQKGNVLKIQIKAEQFLMDLSKELKLFSFSEFLLKLTSNELQ